MIKVLNCDETRLACSRMGQDNCCPVPEPDKVLDRDGTWLSSSRTGQPVPEPGSRFRNRVAKLSGSGTGQCSRSGRNIYIGKTSVVLDNSVPTVFTFGRDEDTVRQKLARYERLLKKREVYPSQTVKARQGFQTTKVLLVKSLMCAAEEWRLIPLVELMKVFRVSHKLRSDL